MMEIGRSSIVVLCFTAQSLAALSIFRMAFVVLWSDVYIGIRNKVCHGKWPQKCSILRTDRGLRSRNARINCLGRHRELIPSVHRESSAFAKYANMKLEFILSRWLLRYFQYVYVCDAQNGYCPSFVPPLLVFFLCYVFSYCFHVHAN